MNNRELRVGDMILYLDMLEEETEAQAVERLKAALNEAGICWYEDSDGIGKVSINIF